jgi:hypothetical protein
MDGGWCGGRTMCCLDLIRLLRTGHEGPVRRTWEDARGHDRGDEGPKKLLEASKEKAGGLPMAIRWRRDREFLIRGGCWTVLYRRVTMAG